MNTLIQLRAMIFFAAISSAHADSLDCAIQRRGTAPLLFSALELDGQAIAATKDVNELQLGLDASLGPNSFVLALQDDLRQVRVAFAGSSLSAAPEGSMLSTNESRVKCQKKPEKPSFDVSFEPKLPEHLVCVLDRLKFVNGQITENKRLLHRATSTTLFLPQQSLKAELEEVGFTVKMQRMDFMRGLEVLLVDKATGNVAHFVGPAKAMSLSFLMGLTQGDREKEAKLYRLGCAYAENPKFFN